jgi:hypothetical protein
MYKVRYCVMLDNKMIVGDCMESSLPSARESGEKNVRSGAAVRAEVLELRGLDWYVLDVIQNRDA